MKIVSHFIDKIIFTVGVLISLQIPPFLNQYYQTMQGFDIALTNQLKSIQKNADQFYQGNIQLLVKDYRTNNNATIQAMADHIEQTLSQKTSHNKDLTFYKNHSLLHNIGYLVIHPKPSLIQSTLEGFVPSIQLSIQALICGLAGGVLMNLLFSFLFYLVSILFRKTRSNELRFVDNTKN